MRLIFAKSFIIIALTVLAGCQKPSDETHAHDTYTCSMHPQIIRDQPGTCPICGMNLVKKTDVQAASGDGSIFIDPATLQTMGVRTQPVEIRPVARKMIANGSVMMDESRTFSVTTRYEGWVERLYVQAEGDRISKGQKLMDIYSPELYAAGQEYLVALRNAQTMKGTIAERDATRLLEATRQKLRLWEVSDAQIRAIETTGKPPRTIAVFAQASGTVTKKSVMQGEKVGMGMSLLELADLSEVWVMAEVFEQDLPFVKTGIPVNLRLISDPAYTGSGVIERIYDQLNPERRTVQARIRVPNGNRALKTGMFVRVDWQAELGEPFPVVPPDAVLRNGETAYVILALENGHFKPVPVQTGVESADAVAIVRGLSGGENVVVSAQFLIDSEANLRNAVRQMEPAPDSASPSANVISVKVLAGGYQPERITIPSGKAVTLRVTRVSDQGCGDQFQSQALGIPLTSLPLNQPVEFKIKPQTAGSYSFTCGMNMFKGTIQVSP